MPGPIRPSEVASKKTTQIPEAVFEAFNEIIAKYWNGHSATFTQKEVAALALVKCKAAADHPDDVGLQTLYDNHWLDVEDSYRKAGWKVVYDRPGYCESYEANFTFRKGTR